jgi:hypothetical protein
MMPFYKHKETGEEVRFASVRISWDEITGDKKEVNLDTGEVISDSYDFMPDGGEYNVRTKKAWMDGNGMR